jgi:phosphate transport system substrate-binding protein
MILMFNPTHNDGLGPSLESGRSGVVGLWIFVLVVLAAMGMFVGHTFMELKKGTRPPFRHAQDRSAREGVAGFFVNAETGAPSKATGKKNASGPTSAKRVLRLAGSGSNLPLTRRLAAAFMDQVPQAQVVVHSSIGSRGGVRACADGRIHLGLISRPIQEQERRFGLKVIPYARVAVVVAAHPTVPADRLTIAEVLDLYRGRRTHWRDSSRVVVLQRERGDSSHLAFGRVFGQFAAVDEQARRKGRFRVLFSDRAMQESLVATRGAVGLFDHGAIVSQRLPLKQLTLAKARPSLAALQEGRYPVYKDLAFVAVEPLAGWAARFVSFVFSPAGRKMIRQNGYLPLGMQKR